MGRSSRWSNWWILESDDGAERLKKLFEEVLKQSGEVRIYTVLDGCSSSGMSRHISAFVPVIRTDGNGRQYADFNCIAREKFISGCGMDMGFELAYLLWQSSGIDEDGKHHYAEKMRHSWL